MVLETADFAKRKADKDDLCMWQHSQDAEEIDRAFTDEGDAFRAFMALPPDEGKERLWEFAMTQSSIKPSDTPYAKLSNNQLRKYAGVGQACIVRERRDQQRTLEFTCEKFPELKFPRRDFKHLYRETRNNLKHLCELWVSNHTGYMRHDLIEQRRLGNNYS